MSEDDSAPPSIDFNTFVLSLSTSALMHLGKLPGGEDQTVNLAHAKQSIDCIALLEERRKAISPVKRRGSSVRFSTTFGCASLQRRKTRTRTLEAGHPSARCV